MTDYAEDKHDMSLPPEVEEEFFRLVELGIHKPGTIMESLGYTRQVVSMRKRRAAEGSLKARSWMSRLDRSMAIGRMAVKTEMLQIAKKAGQWPAYSRVLEIVHGEVHPLDEAKIESIKRADNPETLKAASAAIRAAFATLPVNFHRAIEQEPKKPDGGEEPGTE